MESQWVGEETLGTWELFKTIWTWNLLESLWNGPKRHGNISIDEVSRSSLDSFHIFRTVVYDRYISQTNSYICQKKLLRNVTASK